MEDLFEKYTQAEFFIDVLRGPIFMEKGTDGSAGPEGSYVLFGAWPQTLKEDDIELDRTVVFDIGGWQCLKGDDDYFYVASKILQEDRDLVYSTGACLYDEDSAYFKMEPIKWRILDDNYQGGKLLLAENGLVPGLFDSHINFINMGMERVINEKTVYPNNYEFSLIRAFLNDLDGTDYEVPDFSGKGFITRGFSEKAYGKLRAVNIDNSAESFGKEFVDNSNSNGSNSAPEDSSESDSLSDSGIKYVCNNTVDKVFLLSKADMENPKYGFSAFTETSEDPTRIRHNTDYSIARGALTTDDQVQGKCAWRLRTPAFIDTYSLDVYNGSRSMSMVDREDIAIVPAIVID